MVAVVNSTVLCAWCLTDLESSHHTHERQCQWEVTGVLINLIVVIILQSIHILNHIVHFLKKKTANIK